jgi:hypothetical protein
MELANPGCHPSESSLVDTTRIPRFGAETRRIQLTIGVEVVVKLMLRVQRMAESLATRLFHSRFPRRTQGFSILLLTTPPIC